MQHSRQGDSVFGSVKDSFPDRWGRLLLKRRKGLTAREEQRPVRTLGNTNDHFRKHGFLLTPRGISVDAGGDEECETNEDNK